MKLCGEEKSSEVKIAAIDCDPSIHRVMKKAAKVA